MDSQLLNLIKIDDGLNELMIKMHFTTLGGSTASPSVSCFSCLLMLMRIA